MASEEDKTQLMQLNLLPRIGNRFYISLRLFWMVVGVLARYVHVSTVCENKAFILCNKQPGALGISDTSAEHP